MNGGTGNDSVRFVVCWVAGDSKAIERMGERSSGSPVSGGFDSGGALNLPWKAEFSEYGGYDCMTAAWYIIDAKGTIIAELDCKRKDHTDDHEVRETAAFIVRAANALGEP